MEPLSAWRGPLARWLEGWNGTPAQLWDRVQGALETRPPAYGNLYWTPEGALSSGGCDEKSKGLFLIAALRTLGIPARLRPLDGEPEYWENGGFRPVPPEETGVLRLGRPQGRGPPGRQDAAPRGPAGRPPGMGASPRRGANPLPAPAALVAGRPAHQPGAARPVCPDAGGRAGPRPVSGRDRPRIAGSLELEREAEELPAGILFLLRGRGSLSQPTLAKVLSRFPRIRVLLDDWAYDLEAVARHLGRDPDAPPLAVVCDGAGRAVYSGCGYRVGAVELLLKVAAWVCAGEKEGRIP